ncbi:saccharopine dehydrogenase NADP-binding domain-containing protein [Aestuariicella sp. G3-2]|uniref:saccharopine dehydrogenase family protein n=1 Tax=Pseudomaricurvus albidus TaxID=2842452 RepID=UPI001C0D36A4|nr:saccharopine dehydrogenase NADP-binding domain-containing protein [Aestuariicella albida]MBU3071297.1 saccharopine dehydrogenase NADP-binding domain-containing protein [Aestuariicella albida]
MSVEKKNVILIAGGYGVVGSQVAEIFRQRHPDIKLLIGGRNPAKAMELVQTLDNAEAIALDVESASPLDGLSIKPTAVLNAVNDQHNYLLKDSVRNGIAYVDITRWTERMREAVVNVSMEEIQAPVMFSSAWMAGVAVILAKAASESLDIIDNIDLNILYAMADKAGPNSAEYMDRLTIPFDITVNGKIEQRMPFSDSKSVDFPGGYSGKVYRFDVPDQITLPVTLDARSVSGRIGFDSASATGSLAFMVKSGIMRLLNRPIFDNLRRSMLYDPGEGAAHEIVIEVEGKDKEGCFHKNRVTVFDPQGQTHLTACGAVIQLERVLGLDGKSAPKAGICYPEKAANISAALQLLLDNGVQIKGLATAGHKLSAQAV